MLERLPLGPQQNLAQGARRLLVGEDPPGVPLNERGATRKPLGSPLCFSPLPTDKGAQLGLAKGPAPVVAQVGYFLFPLRAP